MRTMQVGINDSNGYLDIDLRIHTCQWSLTGFFDHVVTSPLALEVQYRVHEVLE